MLPGCARIIHTHKCTVSTILSTALTFQKFHSSQIRDNILISDGLTRLMSQPLGSSIIHATFSSTTTSLYQPLTSDIY